MTILNVNPTRMELGKLKKRLATASRGHKLLKDKQDELIRRFIIMVKENKKLRKEVEQELCIIFSSVTMARALSGKEFLEEAMMSGSNDLEVEIGTKNVMSVDIPVLNFSNISVNSNYGYLNTTCELDASSIKLMQVLPLLLSLTEVEKSCELMAGEIERTRRRVNALEYMTIPQLEETIVFIKMKLEENERSSLTRLMKVKDMINK